MIRAYESSLRTSNAYKRSTGQRHDLLQLDYGDASQLTNYYGEDGEIHACAHNLLRSSADFTDSTAWSPSGTPTADGGGLVTVLALNDRLRHTLDGASSRYLAIAGQAYTLSATIEVTSMTAPGSLYALRAYGTVDGYAASETIVISAVGETFDVSISWAWTDIAGAQLQVPRALTGFVGQVRYTNLCLSVGSKTFPYIQTGIAGAVYKYRLPEYLRGWNGTAWDTTQITEKNSGEAVNAVVEAVAVTNALPNNQWEGAVAGGTLAAGVPTGWTYSETAEVTANGTVEIDDFSVQDGVMVLDVHISGTFVAAGSFLLQRIGLTAAQNDVWSYGGSLALVDDTATAGLSRASFFIQERAGASFLANHEEQVSGATLKANVGRLVADSLAFDTVTLTEATTDNLYFRIQVNVDVGATDVILRIAIPFATKTSWVPQPILTYGSAVTRAAEVPGSAALAGASNDGTSTIEAAIVTAPGSANGVIDGIVASLYAAGGHYFSLMDRDTDGDGDSYVSARANDGAVSIPISNQIMASGSVVGSASGYNDDTGALTTAANDGASNDEGASSGVTLTGPLDANIYLGTLSGAGLAHEILAIKSLSYITNKAATETEAVKRAADLIA